MPNCPDGSDAAPSAAEGVAAFPHEMSGDAACLLIIAQAVGVCVGFYL